ncbi:Polyamine transporter PUT1 [Glycine soja]|uniref:Polyamine transporter PUT1 n=1 Tax=Glycine soja TaxID=3848 RepID=A0A445ITZ3_GLYSO|nr:Polyamine transporter PUT1 [Glycine soja]
MELKAASLRRGYELLKGHQKQKKNRLAKGVLESNIVNPKGNGGVGVVSCTEEVGGVVRMKIVVRKSELKQLVEVMNGGVKSTMSVSCSVEQRLNLLRKKKYLSRANGNHQKCWSPVLQSIPEDKLVYPSFRRWLSKDHSSGCFSFSSHMNYRGLTVVGWAAILLGIFSLLPFMVMGIIAIPRIKPTRWIMVDLNKVNWGLYMNTLFWNLNYWDSISTLSGEVDNPGKTLPRSLFYAVMLVVLGYFLPLLVGTGVMLVNREIWYDERGMVPEFFAKRSRFGTPLVGILFSASGVVLLSWLSFQEIVAAENFLYCFGMLMEFVAFVKLRRKFPYAERLYKVPVGETGAILMCVLPSLLIFVVLALASFKVSIISFSAVITGLVLRPCLKYLEQKRWLRFSDNPDLPDIYAT